MGLLLSDVAASTGHAGLAPSEWIVRWTHLLPPGARVLDLACGSGRHMRWLAAHGHAVLGVDRARAALDAAALHGTVLEAELEEGPWPLDGREFDAVVVTHYLWRPRLPQLLACVAPGGVLLYETFAAGNETVGKPSRPDFLLRPGELLQACADFRVVAYEDGFLAAPPRFVQRIAAVRPPRVAGDAPARHPLAADSAVAHDPGGGLRPMPDQ